MDTYGALPAWAGTAEQGLWGAEWEEGSSPPGVEGMRGAHALCSQAFPWFSSFQQVAQLPQPVFFLGGILFVFKVSRWVYFETFA